MEINRVKFIETNIDSHLPTVKRLHWSASVLLRTDDSLSLSLSLSHGSKPKPTVELGSCSAASPTPTSPLNARRALHVVSAKRFTSRTGRSDGKNKRGTTTTRDQEQDPLRLEGTAEIENVGGGVAVDNVDDGYFLPKLPGDESDFWEGEKWDFLGFFVEYLWAFGIAFALIACFVAAASYNEGATDFKETPVYKDSFQSREFLEEPEATNPGVFESNPTEVAPSLEVFVMKKTFTSDT